MGVLEGMATELFDMYKEMEAEKSGIVASGNGIRKNAALVKIFEEMFNSDMKVPKHLEEATFGAALFALVACGEFKNARDVQNLIKYKEDNYVWN